MTRRKQNRSLTKIELLSEIIEQPPSPRTQGAKPGTYPKALLQTMLPYKNPVETGDLQTDGTWIHQEGAVKIKIQRGQHPVTDEPLDVPHGGLARLIFAYIATQIQNKRNGEEGDHEKRSVDLGRSTRALGRTLNLHKGGQDHKALRRALLSAFACRIEHIDLREREGGRGGSWGLDLFAEHLLFWEQFNPEATQPNDTLSLTGRARLTPSAYQLIVKHAVPIDPRVLSYYRDAPLAQDLYMWLSTKCYETQRLGRDLPAIRWKTLASRFPSTYSDPRNFRRNALKYIEQMKASFWTSLHVELPRGAVVIKKQSPHVPSR